MGGGGDHVGEGDRVRVEAGGDQPGDVGHVDEQQRADLVGDGAEAREVEGLGVRGRDHTQLEERCITLSNVLLGAGLVPVEPQNEVGPLNSYLRWLPSNFDPNEKRALEWYTQMMFAQHIANLSPIWGRTTGYSHIDACRSLGVVDSALRCWVKQLQQERDGVTPKSKALTPEQQKIQELEARINRLEREKAILKKATALLMSDELDRTR